MYSIVSIQFILRKTHIHESSFISERHIMKLLTSVIQFFQNSDNISDGSSLNLPHQIFGQRPFCQI